MKKLLAIFLMFFSCQFLYANDSWSWKHHNKMREQERLKAHLVKQINESGSKKVVEAVVETRPTAAKVGGAMFKRLMSSAGGKMLGAYAVIQLIEGIGWVMEEGTYVKKIPLENNAPPDPDVPKVWVSCTNNGKYNQYHATISSIESCTLEDIQRRFPGMFVSSKSQVISTTQGKVFVCRKDGTCNDYAISYVDNPNYVPGTPPKDRTKKVSLTPELLGAAMLGQGYKDPDPNFNNDTVNDDEWTSVPESYTPDPSGVGNELADELEKKADAATRTSDGKPAPLGDPKYNDDLSSNDSANDRSWENGDEDGTKGSTENTTTTDPETGETTQKGTFKLPAFCDWASVVCEWIDWTKEEPELEDEPLEIEEKELIEYERLNYIEFGQTCPFTPTTHALPLGVLGTLEFETDLTFICTTAVDARPFIIGIGHLAALIFLLIGLRNGNA